MPDDNVDRLIADVDAVNNGGTAWTRPSTAPASSATVLVTSYAYNALGLVQDVTDPMGLDNRTLYDNLGRTTKTIQDYTNGTETAESNISTEYGYDGNGNVTYVQADQPGGSYQKTAYVYGVTTTAGDGVNSNDILAAVQHPDPTSGNPSSTQQDSSLVNALGQVVQATDRNGSVHQYTYDVLGRKTADAVTTLGAGVDGTVRRIAYAYDSQGNNYLITSYNAASGGSIVNQLQRVYNGLGQLTGEYQSHSGAVVQGTTPEVQYAYTEMSGGQNNSRLVSMTYPNNYVLNFNYNTGLDSNISRLSSISDTTGTLESYLYLGLNTVVEQDHPQTNINLTYIKQSGDTLYNSDGGDQYTGLDRFGRVIDQFWINASNATTVDRYQYGYDQDSDVLWRENLVNTAMSELYTYDNLNQLTSFQRGTLNSTKTGISGTPSRTQNWTPDALGNFTSVTTNGTAQTRTANQQNEITSISGQNAPSYDADGNLTADGTGNTYVYDAWNRLVTIKSSSTTLASYSFDGLGRHIKITDGSTTTDLYDSAPDQVLVEYQGSTATAYNVWSPAYVNALLFRNVGSSRYYVLHDADGNVTALVNTSSTVLERYQYDPYGAVTVLSSNWVVQSTSAYNVPYGFQGMRYDWTTAVNIAWARVYDPALMRCLQADPLGLGPDNNPYRWEGNDPIALVSYAKKGIGASQLLPLPTTGVIEGGVIVVVIGEGISRKWFVVSLGTDVTIKQVFPPMLEEEQIVGYQKTIEFLRTLKKSYMKWNEELHTRLTKVEEIIENCKKNNVMVTADFENTTTIKLKQRIEQNNKLITAIKEHLISIEWYLAGLTTTIVKVKTTITVKDIYYQYWYDLQELQKEWETRKQGKSPNSGSSKLYPRPDPPINPGNIFPHRIHPPGIRWLPPFKK